MEKEIQRSIMFRDLSGQIQAWDFSSEVAYGFNQSHAVGHTSHRLLKTIFPEPLSCINKRLISDRVWRGELIHTRANGDQVKVLSEWKVINESGEAPIVQETNALFKPLVPETAQLKTTELQKPRKTFPVKKLLSINLVFILIFTALFLITWLFTHESVLHPLP